MSRARFVLLLALGLCLPAIADDEPPPQPAPDGAEDETPAPAAHDEDTARQAVQEYLDGLLTQDRETFKIGELDVQVSVVPDYFMVLLAREYLKTSTDGRTPEQLRAQFQRFADRNKKSIGKLGVITTLQHPGGGRWGFYAFQGNIDDHVRVVATGTLPLIPVSHDGPFERVELTLFRANRCAVFTAEGQCPPVMKRTMVRLSGEPLTIDLMAKRPVSPKADELTVQLGGFIHFSGSGIAEAQVDFDNGATAVVEPAPRLTFALPLPAPALPAALADVMPTLDD